MKRCINDYSKLYTTHGKKYPQGIPAIINGEKALASYSGDRITGYTTLDELMQVFYSRDLPVCTLEL